MAGRSASKPLSPDVALLEEQVEQINRFPDQNPNPVMRVSEDGLLLYANEASQPIVRALGAAVGSALDADLLAKLRGAAADPSLPPVEIVCDHRTYALLCVPVPEFGFYNVYGTDVTGEKVVARFPDQNPNPVFRVTPDGRLIYANEASEPVVDALGGAVGQQLSKDAWERIESARRGTAAGPFEVRTADAKTFLLTPVFVPEFDFINVYGTDITGEKVVARFPDDNPNPVFRVTPEGRLAYANAASEPVVRALGVKVGDQLAADAFGRIEALCRGEMSDRYEVRTEDARTFVLSPVFIPEFDFINVYGTDVTGEKVVARFPDDNPNPVLRVTPDGRLRYANTASGPIVRGIGATIGEALPDQLSERVLRAADGADDGPLEVTGEGRTFLLKPVWIREFGFINVYGTDVTAARELEKAHRENELLLLNILPEPIARRLREGERVIADRFEDVTLMFADIVGFTQLSSGLPAADLVDILNRVFSAFDGLVGRYGLEKIKTIGDAYMVVGGLPEHMDDHTARVADMALELRDEISAITSGGGAEIRFRVGINVGPVVAGVIGVTKFIYDVWGDTVNTASRMESHGLPDRIHVTRAVRDRLVPRYSFEPRGVIDVKGKGPMETFFLLERVA